MTTRPSSMSPSPGRPLSARGVGRVLDGIDGARTRSLGLGLDYSWDTGLFKVDKIAKNSPAERCEKLIVGSTLLEINGVSVSGMVPKDVVTLLGTDSGTAVSVRFTHPHTQKEEAAFLYREEEGGPEQQSGTGYDGGAIGPSHTAAGNTAARHPMPVQNRPLVTHLASRGLDMDNVLPSRRSDNIPAVNGAAGLRGTLGETSTPYAFSIHGSDNDSRIASARGGGLSNATSPVKSPIADRVPSGPATFAGKHLTKEEFTAGIEEIKAMRQEEQRLLVQAKIRKADLQRQQDEERKNRRAMAQEHKMIMEEIEAVTQQARYFRDSYSESRAAKERDFLSRLSVNKY